jgi:hypothetical protein
MIRGFLEIPDERTLAAFDAVDFAHLRKAVFSAIVDQGFLGSKLEEISLVPRVLPQSFMDTIEDACQKLTKTLLIIASLEKSFLLEYLFPDSRWEKLIKSYGVLDQVPSRMIGELRYDFAICGPPSLENPPLLMEVNAGALGGVVYAGFIPALLKRFVKGLDHLTYYDLGQNFVNLGKRVGRHIANFAVGEYSWGEDLLANACAGQIGFYLVTPVPISDLESWPKLMKVDWHFTPEQRLSICLNGHWQEIDGFRWGRILEHRDIDRFGSLLKQVEDGATTFLSPLRMDYVCHKGILPLLWREDFLVRKLGIPDPDSIRKYVIPSWSLTEIGFPGPREWEKLVLKQNFGCSGKKVFVGQAMEEMADRIEHPEEWIIQKRLELNQMYTRPMYSQDRPMRIDLGVFVHYDFVDGRLEYCRVVGLIARGSQRNRVNLNLGGAAIPIFICPE